MKLTTATALFSAAAAVTASPLVPRGDIEGPFAIGVFSNADFRGKFVNVDASGKVSLSTTRQKVFSLNSKTHRLHTDSGLVLDVSFNLDRPMIYFNGELIMKEYGTPLVAPLSFKPEGQTKSANTFWMVDGDDLELEIVKGEYRPRWYACKKSDGEFDVRFDKVGGGLGKKEPGCASVTLSPVFDWSTV